MFIKNTNTTLLGSYIFAENYSCRIVNGRDIFHRLSVFL